MKARSDIRCRFHIYCYYTLRHTETAGDLSRRPIRVQVATQ